MTDGIECFLLAILAIYELNAGGLSLYDMLWLMLDFP